MHECVNPMMSKQSPFHPLRWPVALALCAVLLASGGIVRTASAQAFSASADFRAIENGTCEAVDDDAQEVIEQMSDLGYSVASAFFEPYEGGSSDFYIPFAEENSAYAISYFPDTGTYSRRMGPRDIVYLRGCTPRELASFLVSYNGFLADRVLDQDVNAIPTVTLPLQASLNDPLLLKELTFESNDDTVSIPPFDRKANWAFTGDRQSFLDLRSSYINADIGDDTLNVQFIPGRVFDFAASESILPRDELTIMIRADKIREYHPDAFDLNPAVGLGVPSEWPLIWVFFRDDTEHAEEIPLELRRTKPPREQTTLARNVRRSFNQLVRTVISHYQDQGFVLQSNQPFKPRGAEVEGQSVYNAEHGAVCSTRTEECQFDNYADAYWWDRRSHQLDDNDFYVVVGVDHTKLGMAEGRSYLGVYRLNDNNGNGFILEEFDSWSGSELAWNTVDGVVSINDPALESVAELSFLAQLTRPLNCADSDDPAFPTFRCPDAVTVAAGDSFVFRGRTTLNPETGTRPDDKQLIPWRLLRFER